MLFKWEDLRFEYEFPPEQGFDCKPSLFCGLCCGMPLKLTLFEINEINNFLSKWLFSQEFKDFVLDYLTFIRTPVDITLSPLFLEKMHKKCQTAFEAFFKPAHFAQKDGALYVLNYRLSSNRYTGSCIFYNPITYECAIYRVRPFECRLYPFNFEYDFHKDRTIKVFIVEKCDALNSREPLNRSFLQETIISSIELLRKENKTLREIGRKYNVSLSMPESRTLKREIRDLHRKMPEIAEFIDSIHVSKKTTETTEIRDLLLEEGLVSCLNKEAYLYYLSHVKNGKVTELEWI